MAMSAQYSVTGRNTHKSVFCFTMYYASKLGVLHDLESAWTVRRPVSNRSVAQKTLIDSKRWKLPKCKGDN